MSEELGAILLNVRNGLSDAVEDNRAQTRGLTDVGRSVQTSQDPHSVLVRLAEELDRATGRTLALEAKLVDASHEVEQLRADLNQAEARSNTDALTGLANRRALESFLRTELIKAMECGDPLSVFLVDIDHFKGFNDRHGHQLGDQVLRVVANCVLEGIRDEDVAARYGGEELMGCSSSRHT